MSVRDYNKQVARRQRIGEATLVVGVDIGSAFNAVGFMSKEGKVLGIYPKMPNSREGFEQFVKITEGLKAKHGLRDVLFSTAHRHKSLRIGPGGRSIAPAGYKRRRFTTLP
jgi:hypothetical protein